MNNNRGNNNRRRGRGNNRPQGGGGGQQLNRIDSRARGNAPQLLEKYRKLAQDAHLNGDRVQAEYYLQFADHYFRVIADSRVRQEEQRARQSGGVAGDRWQDTDADNDGDDFSVESDFPAFDRPHSRREEQRRDDGQRRENRDESRREEGRRDDFRREDNRSERNERSERSERPRRNEQPRPEVVETPQVEATAGEGVRAAEGEPISDTSDNPFIRESRPSRGLKPRTDRRRRDADEQEAPAPGLDPASLPPAFGPRSETVEEVAAEPAPAPVAEEAPAPKRRGRPRKTPAAETAPAEG